MRSCWHQRPSCLPMPLSASGSNQAPKGMYRHVKHDNHPAPGRPPPKGFDLASLGTLAIARSGRQATRSTAVVTAVECIVICREQATVDLENEIASMARSGLHCARAGVGSPLLVLHRQYPQSRDRPLRGAAIIVAVIFDLDGLLADTERLHSSARRQTLAADGIVVRGRGVRRAPDPQRARHHRVHRAPRAGARVRDPPTA
jgi:hypothetical protein